MVSSPSSEGMAEEWKADADFSCSRLLVFPSVYFRSFFDFPKRVMNICYFKPESKSLKSVIIVGIEHFITKGSSKIGSNVLISSVNQKWVVETGGNDLGVDAIYWLCMVCFEAS